MAKSKYIIGHYYVLYACTHLFKYLGEYTYDGNNFEVNHTFDEETGEIYKIKSSYKTRMHNADLYSNSLTFEFYNKMYLFEKRENTISSLLRD